MANYQNLKDAISAAIKTNGNQEITGQVLQDVLNSIVSVIGANYTFAGVATPATNPGTPDQNVMYLAMEGGTYTNFNGTVLPAGISLLMWNGSWTSETVMYGDGGVFDISVYKSSGGTLAKYADLAAALDGGNNIPVGVRKGGMSVKFVQSSDNKYVQYRLMAQDWSTTESDWQGVDDVVVRNSKNLIESGAVYPLAEKVQNVTFKGQSSGNSIEFQTDEGTFIAKISPEGIVAEEVKAIINGQKVSLKNMFVDTLNNIRENLVIGDDNGYDIVNFSNGHILTKYFNSKTVLQRIAAMQEEIVHIQPVESLPTHRRNDFLKDFYSYKYGKANSSWYERFRIMHYSDTHDNLSNLAEAIGLSQGLIHLIVDTGDNANGGVTIPAAATISELQQYATTEADSNTTPSKLLICNGNHDVPNLTKKEYSDIMCHIVATRIPSFVFGDAEHYRTYGYVDMTPNATIGTVRVISLDPFDYDDGQFMNPYGTTGRGGWMNCVFSQAQITWLIDTLRSAANNGYKVITCMHYSWGDNTVFTDSGSANPDANYHQDPFMIPDIINAMQQRTTLNKSYPDDCNINNITVNEDFSNLTNPLHFVCHLFGHIHSENEYQCQKTDGSQLYDILMIGAPNMGSAGYAINKVKLQPGTINSIKCTVLEIDTVEQAIYRVNYGAYKAFDMSIVERTKKIPYRFTN